MRVSASSVINKVQEISATPARSVAEGIGRSSIVIGPECNIHVVTYVRRAYAAGAIGWAAVLPLTAFAASRAHASPIVHALALASYGIGSLICHQRPERSFHLWAAQLPVCARCTGVYVGAAVVAVVARWLQPSAERPPKGFVLLAVVPTAITLAYEWTTGDMPSNGVRFAAGLPLGAVVSWLVFRLRHGYGGQVE
jgi:uncharacterized membrane protein